MKTVSRILLIHPPVVRPTEPPVGISAILGFLAAHGVPCQGWDANLDGILGLLDQPPADPSVWSRQAAESKGGHLKNLRSGSIFRKPASYLKAITDFKRILARSEVAKEGWFITLTNLEHQRHQPFQVSSWVWARENPGENPFVALLAETLEEKLAAFQPTHVGFSMNYLSQTLTTFAFSGYLRMRHPHLKQILGGNLTRAWLENYPESANLFSTFDHAFAENGEACLLQVLRTGDAKPEPPRNPNHLLESSPRYDDFSLTGYLSPAAVLPYSFSRGCYWNQCLFCTEQGEHGGFLTVDPTRGVEVLKSLETRFSPSLFHFGDNALSPAVLKALINRPLATPWYGFQRFIPAFLDPEYCRHLRNAGCVMLQLGLESGHPRVLEEMRKGITPGEAEQALRNLKAAGIGTYVYLLFGTPFETAAEAEATLEFVARNHDSIDFVNLAIFTLPIQDPEAREFRSTGFSQGNLHLSFDFHHPQGWDKTEIRRFLESRFKAHPAIRPICNRKPLCFTSNHAPFFLLNSPQRTKGSG